MWKNIDSAPKNGKQILAAAQGIENTGWMRVIVQWACPEHMFSSSRHPSRCYVECNCEWVGEMGTRFGVPMLLWRELPEVTDTGRIIDLLCDLHHAVHHMIDDSGEASLSIKDNSVTLEMFLDDFQEVSHILEKIDELVPDFNMEHSAVRKILCAETT